MTATRLNRWMVMGRCWVALALLHWLVVAVPAHGQGYIVAEGGGSASGGTWGPAVFGWMVEKSGNGDVVILGVREATNTLAEIFLAHGARSAVNLTITAENADTLEVYDALTNADIIWIRGGNQANYVNFWNGTRTEQAIKEVYERGGVVGGSSAGCAIMGEVIFDALVGSLRPRQALRNPHHRFLTLTTDFLQLTPGVLFDTHFTERGRLGRLLVMMARHYDETGEDILGVGVDHRTALCISPDGTAEVRGEGTVTFLHRTEDTVHLLEHDAPPVITNIAYSQLTEGYVYDLTARRVIRRPPNAERVPPPDGRPAFQDAAVDGSVLEDRAKGRVWVDDDENSSALFHGRLTVQPGEKLLDGLILSTLTWEPAFAENRVGGVQLGLAKNPHLIGLYLDEGARVSAQPPALLHVKPGASDTATAVVLLDAHGMTSRAFSTYTSSATRSAGLRQSVAIEGARLHVLRPGMAYCARERTIVEQASPGRGEDPGVDRTAPQSR